MRLEPKYSMEVRRVMAAKQVAEKRVALPTDSWYVAESKQQVGATEVYQLQHLRR